MKSNNYRFPIDGFGFGFKFINDLPVTHVDTVKCANGDDCIPEDR